MKQMRNLIKGLIISGLALAMISTALAQAPVDVAAKVVRLKGPARYTMGNGVWQPVKLGDTIKPGAVIQTGKDQGCFLDLVLSETGSAEVVKSSSFKPFLPSSQMYYHGAATSQNVVRLWQNTALGLDKLTRLQTGADMVNETQLDLKAGRITGTVKKLTPGSRYEIKLPNGVAGIRGTVYDITAEGVLRVIEGTVIIALVGSNGDPVTVEVPANNQYDPATGKITPLPAGSRAALDREIGTVRYTQAGSSSSVSLDKTIWYNMSQHTTGNNP